jgi:outer membrane protein OmpA-like peptidoglycan-associated protein
MNRRLERVGWLVFAGIFIALAGCANQPASSKATGRSGAHPRPPLAGAETAQLASVESALRGRLVSTDAFLVDDPGHIRLRVTAPALFLPDTANLMTGADAVLEPLAASLSDKSAISVDVRCYADDLDQSPAAVRLTQQRAETVAAYLAHHGVASERIQSHGEGSSAPIAINSEPEGRRANRRIEIIISALSS